MGAGRIVTYTADTTTLQGAERRLYKGYEIARDGSVRILMHDQMAARDMANKSAALYIQRNENKNLNLHATVLVDEHATPDALLASYKLTRVVQP
jgi:hypothetical protein